jgi:flagellar biosynthesis/type III secretory pathway M-ring protein FliF/YscJ|tara:strand:+ start:831 stop:938 length:108 start_codon:yes stop_codon:yes gene_type:complete
MDKLNKVKDWVMALDKKKKIALAVVVVIVVIALSM